MKTYLVCFSILGLLTGASAQKMIKLWETPAELAVPESVFFDDSVIYVSNVNGKPTDKDGNGFLSRLSVDGKIIEKEWITGLDAPKGMAVYGSLMYVSDISRVAVIDRTKGKILEFIDIPGSAFLNDVTVSDKGVVAVSDMSTSTIYVITNKKASLLVTDARLNHVNGLYWENETLFAGVANAIYAIDVNNRSIKLHIDNTGPIDGLERFDEHRFIFSDWKGNVQISGADKPPVYLLNASTDNYNAADIDFSFRTQTLFVPTFFGNTIAAYRVE